MRTAVIYNFLLEANLMASIAIVLMILVRKFMRKPLGNRVIYFAWLLVAIRLLCPLALPNPAINTIRSAFAQDAAIRPIAGQLQVRFSDAVWDVSNWIAGTAGYGSAISNRATSFANSTNNGMLSLHLMQFYVLGVLLVIIWFVLSNLRFRRRLKSGRIEPISGKLLEEYQALCAERGVKPIPVYFTDPLPSACLVGVVRPYIALPLTAKPQEAATVLTHEICHLKGGDHIWGLVRLLCCAVHWFNPLVWAAAHMSRTDSELACDDRVIRKLSGPQRLAYANVLVLAASRRNAPGVAVLATGMTMTGRSLKTRVQAILHNGSIKKGLALSFAIVACMALVGAFATAEVAKAVSLPQVEASEIQAHEITSQADAIDYAKTLWQSEYLAQDIAGLTWSVEENDGEYYVTAGEETSKLIAHFGTDGVVTYLYNGPSGCDNARITDTTCEDQQDDLAMYLLGFVDALNAGDSDKIEAFQLGEQTALDDCSYVTFLGFTYSPEPDGVDTYSLFTIQLAPVVRVVNYSTGIPQSVIGGGVG